MEAIYIVLGALFGAVGVYLYTSNQKAQRSLEEEQKVLQKKQELLDIESQIKEKQREAKEVIYEAQQKATGIVSEAQQSIQQEKISLEKDRSRIEEREQFLEKQEKSLDSRFEKVEEQATALKEEKEKISKALDEQKSALESIAKLSQEEARTELLDRVEADSKEVLLKHISKVESDAKATAEEKARNIICQALQRIASEVATEKTTTVVQLASDELKGRIIGREGRNINAIEMATGVDVIIDDTPNAVTVSGFDPARRYVAKLLIERLVEDGRIHPARIEELAERAREDTNKLMLELGEKTLLDMGITGIHQELVMILGRLHFRTSYGQNQLKHAQEVAYICMHLAGQLGVDQQKAKMAGLFHDIGKAVDHEVEGGHAVIGYEMLTKYGVDPEAAYAVGSHHEDMPITTPLGFIVCAADAISGARPGARRENFEAYIKRLKDLEGIAKSFEGVKHVYAIQAGREVRVMVDPADIDDYGARKLALDIAGKVEKEMSYPGQIKVHVIREIREVEYAK